MKNKTSISWGIIFAASFGVLTFLALRGGSGMGRAEAAVALLLWPVSQILLLFGSIFQNVSIRLIGTPVFLVYMCLLGFFAGYFLNRLYSKIRRRHIS